MDTIYYMSSIDCITFAYDTVIGYYLVILFSSLNFIYKMLSLEKHKSHQKYAYCSLLLILFILSYLRITSAF